MLRKESNLYSALFANPSHRLGIVLVILVISFAILSVSLSGQAGIFSATSRSYAQASSSIFGVEANPLSVAGGLNWITQTQTAWVRGPVVRWSEIETTQGIYNWSNLGDVILELQAAVSNGFEPIVVVTGTPTWAQKYAGYSCGPIELTQFTAFGNFIAAMLTSPSSPLAPLNIQYVELWNEPDLSWNSVTRPDYPFAGCWGEEGDTLYYGGSYYGEMLKAVYPLIKAAAPQVQVLVGGLLLDCDPNQPPIWQGLHLFEVPGRHPG